MSLLLGSGPSFYYIGAVENLVERELEAHNKPNIEVSMTLHLHTQ